MIIRILNETKDTDKFFDCRNTCLVDNVDVDKKTILIFEFISGESIQVVLDPGDQVYYMNDVGKTVQADVRMLGR